MLMYIKSSFAALPLTTFLIQGSSFVLVYLLTHAHLLADYMQIIRSVSRADLHPTVSNLRSHFIMLLPLDVSDSSPSAIETSVSLGGLKQPLSER